MWTARADVRVNGQPTTLEIELFMRRSTVLPRCRNSLVQDALDWNAHYLLWADGDHHFPRDALIRLLSHNLPIVGVNYPRRAEPTAPTAVSLEGYLVWTDRTLAEQGAVQSVAHLGLGLCLIDINVFHAIRANETEPRPFFAYEMIGDGRQIVAEDVGFFRRARDAGFAVHVDHSLSWQVGHLHSRLLTNAHALADREAAV